VSEAGEGLSRQQGAGSIIYPLIQWANREPGSKGVRPRISSENSCGVRNRRAPRSAAATFGQLLRGGRAEISQQTAPAAWPGAPYSADRLVRLTGAVISSQAGQVNHQLN
jgi:hypothetical protein